MLKHQLPGNNVLTEADQSKLGSRRDRYGVFGGESGQTEFDQIVSQQKSKLLDNIDGGGKNSTAETCEKIKKVYENELHYVLTGEEIEMPWEEWADID